MGDHDARLAQHLTHDGPEEHPPGRRILQRDLPHREAGDRSGRDQRFFTSTRARMMTVSALAAGEIAMFPV